MSSSEDKQQAQAEEAPPPSPASPPPASAATEGGEEASASPPAAGAGATASSTTEEQEAPAPAAAPEDQSEAGAGSAEESPANGKGGAAGLKARGTLQRALKALPHPRLPHSRRRAGPRGMTKAAGIMQENFEDLVSPNLWRSLACEFFGTLFVVLLGCGAWLGWTVPNSPTVVQLALTFGLAVATVVWSFSHISGGHVNPAVTIAALVTRRVSIVRGVLYMVCQVVGGIVGAGILFGLVPVKVRGSLGVTVLSPVDGMGSAQGFGVEFLVTFVYVLTVFASSDEARRDLRGSAPLTIGLAVVVCHLFAIPFTSCGMNPARSFGPAVIMGVWEHHWVYWVGPLVGGVIAGLLYEFVFSAGANIAKVRKCLLRSRAPKPAPAEPAEKEKEPLDDGKMEVIEIEESKLDETTQDDKAKLTEEDKE